MPIYYPIKKMPLPADRKRTAEKLLALKQALSEIPEKRVNGNLLLATWNIREFDSEAYGRRSEECIFYMAEIIERFDLIAIQEVRDNLEGLERLQNVLGSWWKVMYTDVTEGSGGNKERLAYLYDSRKVTFGGLSGEVVIPPIETKDASGKKVVNPSEQLVRSPYIVGFKSGWFRFVICTVHILYGDEIADDPKRVKEIEELSKFMKAKADSQKEWSNNMILLGDFNIFDPTNKTFAAIARNFTIPEMLQKLPSNALKNKHYDQIAFRLENDMGLATIKAGVFDYYQHVFKEEEYQLYGPMMGEAFNKTADGKARDEKGKKAYYKTYWRTHQMSDHLPMWVELKTDLSEGYLKELQK